MATLTIRNLDDATKSRLRVRAARHGRSMEEETRAILRTAVAAEGEDGAPRPSFGEEMLALFGPENGVELELPPREPAREPPDFS